MLGAGFTVGGKFSRRSPWWSGLLLLVGGNLIVILFFAFGPHSSSLLFSAALALRRVPFPVYLFRVSWSGASVVKHIFLIPMKGTINSANSLARENEIIFLCPSPSRRSSHDEVWHTFDAFQLLIVQRSCAACATTRLLDRTPPSLGACFRFHNGIHL